MTTIDALVDFYEKRGHQAYAGEHVSQLEHAWQCAQLAREAGASEALQLAAWLHDVGHLSAGLGETPTLQGVDDRHEHAGAALLSACFGADVTEPVRLHVAAKRYLVTTQAGYGARLSEDSLRSLALQGGPMSALEAQTFARHPFARSAQQLRVWDDLAKRSGWFAAGPQQALAQLRALSQRVWAAQAAISG